MCDPLNTQILHNKVLNSDGTSKYEKLGQMVSGSSWPGSLRNCFQGGIKDDHCIIGCEESNLAGVEFDPSQYYSTTCNEPVKVGRQGKTFVKPHKFNWNYNKAQPIGWRRGGGVDDYKCLWKCDINSIDKEIYKNVESCNTGYPNYYMDKDMNLIVDDIGKCNNIQCNTENGYYELQPAITYINPPNPLSRMTGICEFNTISNSAEWILPSCTLRQDHQLSWTHPGESSNLANTDASNCGINMDGMDFGMDFDMNAVLDFDTR